MAIYAVQGLYAAGCLFTTYALCRHGLNLSFFSNPARVVTGAIKQFADIRAKEMGLEKEVILIARTDIYKTYGNAWFPGKVTIGVPLENTDGEVSNNEEVESDGVAEVIITPISNNEEVGCDLFAEFRITHSLAHIKSNDLLIIPGATLAASLFTTFVLTVNYDLFTRYLGGLGVALITAAIVHKSAARRAELTAMQHCSNDVNRTFLNWLVARKEEGCDRGLLSWVFCLVKPSFEERIGYFQAHLDSQKDGL